MARFLVFDLIDQRVISSFVAPVRSGTIAIPRLIAWNGCAVVVDRSSTDGAEAGFIEAEEHAEAISPTPEP